MLSATASLGLILLWDVEGGLTQIDKFLYSNEDYIKVSQNDIMLQSSIFPEAFLADICMTNAIMQSV